MGIPYAEVIGDPIAHSRSPMIHNFWLKKLGIEGDYRAVRVRPDELEAHFETRRRDPDWRGCNVTMPHKRNVEDLLDWIDPSSEWAGSTNCVYRDGDKLCGCNTDGSGIAAAIDGASVHQNPVVVIGSGAAARTALWILAMEEPSELRVVARNLDQATGVLDGLRPAGRRFEMSEADAAFSGATVIINATPLGMSGFNQMSPDLLGAIRHSSVDATIVEMVYAPRETMLLAAAQSFGRRWRDGLVMLVGQAQDSFGHFFSGSPPASSWDDGDLRALLTS